MRNQSMAIPKFYLASSLLKNLVAKTAEYNRDMRSDRRKRYDAEVQKAVDELIAKRKAERESAVVGELIAVEDPVKNSTEEAPDA